MQDAKKGKVMKRYKISVFGGGERADVVMDLRPTELKTIERFAQILLEECGEFYGVPSIDIEEV